MQVLVTDFRRDNAAALDTDLQPVKQLGDLAKRIKRSVQTIQPARMILLVEAFGSQEQMKISKSALNVSSFLVHASRYRSWEYAREGPQ
jgi:hypothetical protein